MSSDAGTPGGEASIEYTVGTAFRAGDLDRAHEVLERFEGEGSVAPEQHWRIGRARAAVTLANGRVEPARQLALQALAAVRGTDDEPVSLLHFGYQITALLRERRKFDDARPTIETWAVDQPANPRFRAWRSWIRSVNGDDAAARSDLEIFFARHLNEADITHDQVHAWCLAVSAATALDAPIGTASPDGNALVHEWCRGARAKLAPHIDDWITVGDITLVEGPVVRVAALASSAIGETERALIENEQALQSATQAGAALFIWHAIRDRGLILSRAGRTEEAAVQLLEAANRYRSAGLERQAAWCEHQAGNLATASTSVNKADRLLPGEFRRQGNVWQVALSGDAASIRHLKGMPMLHALLGAPGREIAATDLAAVGEASTGLAGGAKGVETLQQPVIDAVAVAAYRRRLDEIAVELDRADQRGDVEASQELSAEFDAITSELVTTQGLGGRTRHMVDEGERARVRVTKSIRSSIRRIGERHPNVADYLDRTISTGRFCIYQPDQARPVSWQL